MTGMLMLAERVEAQTEPSALIFQAAYALTNGGKLFDQPATDGFQATYSRWRTFSDLMTAGGWTDAAFMLVPPTYHLLGASDGNRDAPWHVRLGPTEIPDYARTFDDIRTLQAYGDASMFPLALLAAALRATAHVQFDPVPFAGGGR